MKSPERTTNRIQYTCTANELEALDYYSDLENRTRADTIHAILRRSLIVCPSYIALIGFPHDQSLRKWIEAHQRLARGESADFDPEKPVAFSLAPLSTMESERKAKVEITVNKEMHEALRAFSDHALTSFPVGKTARHIVRSHLISEPYGIEMPSFPRWQQLSLWVRANIERFNKSWGTDHREPPVSMWERFGLSADGSRVIRFDYVTAG